MAAHAVGTLWRGTDGAEVCVPWNTSARAIDTSLDLADQFIALNRPVLDQWGVAARVHHRRRVARANAQVELAFRLGSTIGAMPLRSPSNGKVEHGLLVEPRFGWAGVGAMLVGTGARVLPEIPRLPTLPRSESGVPPWVLSSVVLARLESLLGELSRRFVETREVLDRPRGRVQWAEYLGRHLGQGHPERVPCVHGSLREDERWLAAVHASLRVHQQSLASVQRDALIVRRLLARCDALRRRVEHVAPRWDLLNAPLMQALNGDILLEGLQALQWSRDHQGLAGIHPLGGLPWQLPMERVFEAWIETLADDIARRRGGVVRIGSRRETLRALRWSPPYQGSQRYLLPDVEITSADETVILDAKYKSHWEEIDAERWFGTRDDVREAHRGDLLQVLAYAAASSTPRVSCVLVYPCGEDTWISLRERRRTYHVAEVPAGARSVRLILAAVPLAGDTQEIVSPLLRALAA